jgi:hypothetical protein
VGSLRDKSPAMLNAEVSKVLPIKGTHGEDISSAVSQCFDGCFHVRQLLHQEVHFFAVGINCALNMKSNAVAAGRRR